MSKIIFITSEKPIKLEQYDIIQIKPNDYTYYHYPCLKGKKYIYDFENFNNTISYKNLIDEIVSLVEEDNNIVILVLEQTEDKSEIDELNKKIKNKFIINLSENNAKVYDLIYRLERNSLSTSTEYSFLID